MSEFTDYFAKLAAERRMWSAQMADNHTRYSNALILAALEHHGTRGIHRALPNVEAPIEETEKDCYLCAMDDKAKLEREDA